MFCARWKKEAKLLSKGARKFLSYKRDLLPAEKVSEVESAHTTLQAAIKSQDREAVKSAEKQLTQAWEKALPDYRRPGMLPENIEILFVAIVIALGIRAYFLQPFRIPTGSMQPTLNGIVGHRLDRKDFPSFPVKAWQAVVGGRKYVHRDVNVTSRNRYLKQHPGKQAGRPWITEEQRLQFFNATRLHFEDGETMSLPAPRSALEKMGLTVRFDPDRRKSYVPADTTVSGYTITGDLVLVDKVSYHLRRPRRGEVFVFDTRGIEGIHLRSERDQGAGSHYIKRLAGLPGDRIHIEEPLLMINGLPAREKYLRMVGNREGIFGAADGVGYHPTRRAEPLPQSIRWPGDSLQLQNRSDLIRGEYGGMNAYLRREYFALGDNTRNSLDSRYWGAVREYNLVGPAFLSLWPFTSGHWGPIK